MKFLVDRMLGSLATWLRVLGFDAAYFTEQYSRKIVYQSLKEKRIILTRNTKVSSQRAYQLILLSTNDLVEQLKSVFTRMRLTVKKEMLFSRCTYCNVPVKKISKKDVVAKVPKYVYETTDVFSICALCGRIYWKGTHNKLLIEQLKKMDITVYEK